ncbi:kinesin, putative [Bodo saltans]|uniref:Kinesin, putative n=1 Tax=Bodo saltans TaxID=75058 RepID=A0A0S4JFN3_BODSA|nr:kinesin, putative [Bodo saltans]|eukprot:CUG90355.1 kinesin, putative [Bodo saltans]
MTPRTTAGVAAAAAALSTTAAAPRPASGLKATKTSPSPPPSRQTDAKPPTTSKALDASPNMPAAPPLIPNTLPELMELFLAKATSGPAANSKQHTERIWSSVDWSTSSAETAAAALGSAVASLGGDGQLVINVVPNEVQANIAPSAAASTVPSCDVVVSAGAPGKQLCRTAGGAAQQILLTPLNHAGGSRDSLPVVWSEGLNWSVDAPELRLTGTGACPTGGASVQRGCVTLKTAASGASATVTVTASSHNNGGSSSSKVAVVSAELATTFSGQQTIEESFTHAGDESLTKFKLSASAPSEVSSSKQRPPSGSVEARRRKAKVSVMDNLAQYEGEVDVLSKRFLGLGVFSITTGSSTSSKYDGDWSDSLRHGAKGHWTVGLPPPSSSSTNSAGVSSVEYTGPFHNDARHGKAGRLTIRKQSAGGIHVDADWDHGELDGLVTLSSVDDTQTIVSCGFTSGTVAPNVTLTFPSGAFVGKWLSPKSVASAAVALAASTPASVVASGGVSSSISIPPPLELLQQSTAGVLANVSKSVDAMGAVDCVIQSIANPMLADQIRGPVAEFLASRVACDLGRVCAVATVAKSQLETREKQMEGIKRNLSDAQSRLSEQQQALSKAEKKRAALLSERDKAASALEKLVQQRDAAMAEFENTDGAEGAEKMKLAQQALRALGTEKTTLDKQITDLNEQISSAKSDAKKFAQKRDASAKDLKAVETEIAQLTEKLAGFATLIEAQAVKQSTVEQEAEAVQLKLESSKQSAQEQLAILQRQLASLNDNDSGASAAAAEGLESTLKELKVSNRETT